MAAHAFILGVERDGLLHVIRDEGEMIDAFETRP